MGLRIRLTLLFSAAVALLAIAGALLLIDQLSSGMNTAMDRSLSVRADALVQQVGPGGTVTNFQDGAGPTTLLSPVDTLAQVIGPTGVPLESSEGAAHGRPLLTPAQLARARLGPLTLTSSGPNATEVRLLAVPVTDSADPPAVVVVGASRRVVLAAVQRVRTALWFGGPATVVLGGVGAWLLAGAALRPVERMRAQAAVISAGDGEARLALPARRDEITRLGETINALLARLQRALAQQRMFVADAGHELRTPLTALRTELELAARPGRDRDSLAAAVHAAAQDTDRLIRLAEELLSLAQTDHAENPIDHRRVRLDRLVAQAAAAVDATAGAGGVRLDIQQRDVATVLGDRDRLRRVIDNLLDNALRHAPPGSTVTVATAAPAASGVVVLQVADRGPGFPADFLPRAFDRFTRADTARTDTARTDRTGTGLGLAIVASLVHEHGGTVSACNRAGGGAELRVVLPRVPDSPDWPDADSLM